MRGVACHGSTNLLHRVAAWQRCCGSSWVSQRTLVGKGPRLLFHTTILLPCLPGAGGQGLRGQHRRRPGCHAARPRRLTGRGACRPPRRPLLHHGRGHQRRGVRRLGQIRAHRGRAGPWREGGGAGSGRAYAWLDREESGERKRWAGDRGLARTAPCNRCPMHGRASGVCTWQAPWKLSCSAKGHCPRHCLQ